MADIERVLAWARSLPTQHKCQWKSVVREVNGMYDPIDLVCDICDAVQHTAMMRACG